MISRICIISFLIWVISGRTFSQFKLTKVEEFKIESLSEIDLLDYYPSGKLFLGFKKTSKENDIVLIDSKGEILVVKDLLGDSPPKRRFYSAALKCRLRLGGDSTFYLWLHDKFLFSRQ